MTDSDVDLPITAIIDQFPVIQIKITDSTKESYCRL